MTVVPKRSWLLPPTLLLPDIPLRATIKLGVRGPLESGKVGVGVYRGGGLAECSPAMSKPQLQTLCAEHAVGLLTQPDSAEPSRQAPTVSSSTPQQQQQHCMSSPEA